MVSRQLWFCIIKITSSSYLSFVSCSNFRFLCYSACHHFPYFLQRFKDKIIRNFTFFLHFRFLTHFNFFCFPGVGLNNQHPFWPNYPPFLTKHFNWPGGISPYSPLWIHLCLQWRDDFPCLGIHNILALFRILWFLILNISNLHLLLENLSMRID